MPDLSAKLPLSTAIRPLAVEDLTCRYAARQTPAIMDISFSLAAGQIVLIAGASGSGKTTLLRCLNGLIPRSYKAELSGRVWLNGEDYSDRPLAEVSQVVGTVLQDPERQILGAYVRNEVAFGLENLGLPRNEIARRIDETLEYLGIGGLQNRETFSLSGGEKQKVALAGVLAMQPAVLALDEPLANLDSASAHDALTLVRRLADEGKAILIIEHRVEDALRLKPDLVMYLENGKVTYTGSVEGLMQTADYKAVKLPAPVVIERMRGMRAKPPAAPAPSARADAPAVVEFEGVSFNYPEGPPVLRGVDLAIRQGDLIAVLGPNGAGKTTLLKHAVGLLRPTEGRVLLEGVDSRSLTIAKMARAVGYVFQSPRHMLFAPTVAEELAFGPRNLGIPGDEIEENTRQALGVVHLVGEIDRPPLALSFGQQKRVSIAAILAMRSAILVMDEPTAGQDFANYMSFMDSVAGLAKETGNGKGYDFSAIIFITHDVDLAISYANRVLIVSSGRIEADGPPDEVLSDFDLLRKSRIVPSSLLKANVEHYGATGRFMRAEWLAGALTVK
ncbi:MAG TPA: ABC transporter ATP-binding protein [Anaerolineales bacterium]|nr:ABC transporter ATP-binding protein [Anaerolineales bacterium]